MSFKLYSQQFEGMNMYNYVQIMLLNMFNVLTISRDTQVQTIQKIEVNFFLGFLG